MKKRKLNQSESAKKMALESPIISAGFSSWALSLLESESERTRDIIKKRFGLDCQEPQTLEKIGQEYGITRERVRQIISDAVKKIAKNEDKIAFQKAEEKIVFTIGENSGIMEESQLIKKLSQGNHLEANAVAFFGTLSERIGIAEEKKLIKKSWVILDETVEKVKKIGSLALEVFKKENKLLDDSEIVEKVIQKGEKLSPKEILDYLSVFYPVSRNKFGKWGLTHWPEVNPRGTRERIYLVLKEKNTPLHFTEIANFIDEYELTSKKAHPQTVHNELIKDERFVLIGRGTYALNEWGYEQGTVREVLEKILKESKKPLDKDEIVEKVFQLRKVKKTTVMINLNDSRFFAKIDNHSYQLRK